MRYGYCRISRPKQSIERQIRNIKAAFPDAGEQLREIAAEHHPVADKGKSLFVAAKRRASKGGGSLALAVLRRRDWRGAVCPSLVCVCALLLDFSHGIAF